MEPDQRSFRKIEIITTMIRRAVTWQAGILLLVIAGCNPSKLGRSVAESYLPDAASVAFDLEPLQGGSGQQQWIATYASRGTTARFRIELGKSKASTQGTKDFNMKVGEGRFVAEAGSDASVLLVDLQKALEAKKLPKPAPRANSLAFTFANIGENLSQIAGGGFNTEPPGNWTAMKIFVGEGDQEGEVFLNINTKIKKGQFSLKDPDYGDLVLGELAKVL
jgi:hypothetical protein